MKHTKTGAFAVFLALAGLVTFGATTANAAPVTTVYNAIPSPLPPNVASVGFQALSTSEFGDLVHLAGKARTLSSVTVTMSDWAVYADYVADARYSANPASWTHPITVNVYSSHLGVNGVPDTLLATKAQTVTIPWRPVADPTCSTPTAWRAADHLCYNGFAFNVTFNMPSAALPNDVIVGVAFSTQSYGSSPLGVNGPYNSLNVGAPNAQTASVGTDVSADKVFWNTSHAAFYADGGAAGVGTFRQDTNWTPNGTVAFKITARNGKNDNEQGDDRGHDDQGHGDDRDHHDDGGKKTAQA